MISERRLREISKFATSGLHPNERMIVLVFEEGDQAESVKFFANFAPDRVKTIFHDFYQFLMQPRQ